MTPFYKDEDIEVYEDDGIVVLRYYCKILTLAISEKSVSKRLELMNGRNMPCLLDGHQVKYGNLSAMKYAAYSEEGTRGMIAGAILTSNIVQEIIATFFLRINPPGLPTRIFSDYDSARKWLKYSETWIR